jgi:NADPH:quinone reductase-like Zn-dependent oxidoreductase
MAKVIKPQGKICSSVDTSNVDLSLLKSKSATFVWEFMFTRSMYKTCDMIEQQRLLNNVSELIDSGILVTTANTLLHPINAENLRKAHKMMEQGNAIGKVVLSDWA